MANRLSLLIFRLAVLVALCVSTALLIDYFRPLPAFCDVGSGCDQIRASGRGKLFGRIPIPIIGVVAFALTMTLSLVPGKRAARVTRVLGVLGGAAGLVFLWIQAIELKVFCKLCVAVDSAAIVAALAMLASLFVSRNLAKTSPAEASSVPAGRLWPVATLAAMLIPAGWSFLQPSPPVPREVASLWVPDKINVIEFVDFQCEFCRQLQPTIVDLLEEHGSRINFVRLNMPLASHPQARSAARAYCCADEQKKGSVMAEALLKSDDLTPQGCEKLAAELGLSIAEYRECVKSAATDARIDDEIARVKRAGLAGLPTVWVEDEVIVGRDPAHLRDAFTRAANEKPRTRLPTSLMWAAFTIALGIVGALALRGRREPDAM
ncbi:MAG TPA: vitamin K epoxide reductase family protein [Polyangiaceae bacterium]|nr:vitamin K epoxide reductase family protein [Polyangiaceae bacterium]